MKSPAGMPGPGGSLGWCAICGKPFLLEILMNKTVKSFEVDGCDNTLFAHAACLKSLPKDGNFDVLTLPPESPLRQAYERK